jgi:hypothetical protein
MTCRCSVDPAPAPDGVRRKEGVPVGEGGNSGPPLAGAEGEWEFGGKCRFGERNSGRTLKTDKGKETDQRQKGT